MSCEIWQEDNIFEKMKERYLDNAALISVVERNCHENVKIVGKSVRLKDKVSGNYFFSAQNTQDLDILLEDVTDELETFYINTDRFKEKISCRFPHCSISEYVAFIARKEDFVHEEKPRAVFPEGFTTAKLDLSWLEFILSRYCDEEFGNRDYILDRLLYGKGLGAVKNGKKIGFIMQHKDGEIGPFMVDEEFRRLGVGKALLSAFQSKLFAENSLAYALVKIDNIASLRTMKAGGYQKADQHILWVYLKNKKSILEE